MYKATISLPSIASEVSAAARLQFSKAAMLFSDDAIKRSVLISGNPLSPALAELYLRGLWSARPSGWFDRQLVANGTFDQEPVGLLPSIGFHYKMDRILLESDVDVQYVGSCAPFVRPQILEKPAGRAALKKFQNTLDLASVVLAGNAECAVQLQRYFAVDSESIIVLPVLPRLHKFKTPGQVNGLGKFNLIYLPAGPKSLRVKDVKTIKNEFRRIALDDPLVVTWDEGFGRPNSKWGTAFTAQMEVTQARRQWLFSQANSVLFWGDSDLARTAALEAQMVARSVALPQIDACAPPPLELPDRPNHVLWYDAASSTSMLDAFSRATFSASASIPVDAEYAEKVEAIRQQEQSLSRSRWDDVKNRLLGALDL